MSDINALKQLLDERDKELALAASLGKDLLDRNRELEAKCESLEKLLAAERDSAAQLKHELNRKEELLVIYAMNEDRQQTKQAASKSLSVETSSSLQLATMERRIRQLESENFELRAAAAERQQQRWNPDVERETALVKDCVRQLAESNLHIKGLADNLTQRTELYMGQQAEITQLLAKNVSLESKVKRVSMERDMHESRLKETQLTQRALTSELACVRDRYDECLAMLDKSQHEAASLRRRLKSAVQRSSSAAAAVAMQTTGRQQQPQQHQSVRPGASHSGAGAIVSPVAPPPPYELSLMSELERSAGADSGLAGSLHYIRNVKSANATGQSIRRRHMAHQQQQQQQQQQRQPHTTPQNNRRSVHHNRNLQLQAAVSAENIRAEEAFTTERQQSQRQRPNSAGIARISCHGCRSMSLGGNGIAAAGRTSDEGLLSREISNWSVNLQSVYTQSWRNLFRSVSAGNLTSPLLESPCFPGAHDIRQQIMADINRSLGAISASAGAATAAESNSQVQHHHRWRGKYRRQSAVTNDSPHHHQPLRPTRLRRCRRRHQHSAEIAAASARHLSSSATSLSSLTSEAAAAALVSASSMDFEEFEHEEAELGDVSMATSTQTDSQTQTQTPGSSSQFDESLGRQTPMARIPVSLGEQTTRNSSSSHTLTSITFDDRQAPNQSRYNHYHHHEPVQRQQQEQQRLAWLGGYANNVYAAERRHRLQFAKKFGGSTNLEQWSRLAAPGLHAVLAPARRLRGVAFRGAEAEAEWEAFDNRQDGAENFDQRTEIPQLQPSQRATSLDAGINNCFLEIADSVKPHRNAAQHPLHQLRQLSNSLSEIDNFNNSINEDDAEIGDDERKPFAAAGKFNAERGGWFLPTIGASILRSLLQLSFVTAGLVVEPPTEQFDIEVSSGDSTDEDDKDSRSAFDSSSGFSHPGCDPRTAGLNLFCPATGEVHRTLSRFSVNSLLSDLESNKTGGSASRSGLKL